MPAHMAELCAEALASFVITGARDSDFKASKRRLSKRIVISFHEGD